ncbi:YcgJ family protein [Pseudomonas sp. PDM25]|uniref:YcgJ family protein n=1 Tax=Pseudomonas sp. PDM25 TaxID=2854772 RepID=UPI001C448015|nr:YcgJ family protein [Pseudomonas sp. PDM25]
MSEFTFVNGIFCDVKERLCREDRYYGVDGKLCEAVSKKYTQLLFDQLITERRSGVRTAGRRRCELFAYRDPC